MMIISKLIIETPTILLLIFLINWELITALHQIYASSKITNMRVILRVHLCQLGYSIINW